MPKKNTSTHFAGLLISHGAEVTDSSVIFAARRRDLALLAELLDGGGSSNATDERGASPLMIAAQFDDVQTIELLIIKKADHARLDSAGLSALEWAISTESWNAKRLLESLDTACPSLASTPRCNEALAKHLPKGHPINAPAYMAAGLIHVTLTGIRVRSKSELLIANTLSHLNMPFDYELPYFGLRERGVRLPDFSFRTYNQKIIIWEHLGMLGDERYKERWNKKRAWYLENGLVFESTLFVSADDQAGGLNSQEILQTAKKIKAKLIAG